MQKISLVIPSFNAQATIERAILSIINQDYSALELILVDGASTDDTLKIVEKYRDYFSVIISEPDTGQANALNKGFKKATGDIFGYLCADDELAPGSLAHVNGLFDLNPDAGIVTGGCKRFYPDQTVYHTIPNDALLQKISYLNSIEQPSTFWRVSFHKKVGELDESFYFAFDFDFWNKLYRSGAKIITTEQILSHFYFTGDNKTARGGTALVKEMYRVVKRYGPYFGFLADIYMFIYTHFDLNGYIDGLSPHGKWRKFWAQKTWKMLITLLNPDYIKSYNWNFAAKQQRGLTWWK